MEECYIKYTLSQYGGGKPNGVSHKSRFLALIMIMILVAGPILTVNTSGANSTFSVNLPGEDPQDHLVRGFWHNMTIHAPQNDVTITMTRGVTPQNETNHYVWSYKGGVWRDELYSDTYLDPGECRSSGSDLVFRLGVDTTALTGPWNIDVVDSTGSLFTGTISVVSSLRELALSAPDYFIIAEENTNAWIPTIPNQYFRIINDGNVPLGVPDISFTANGAIDLGSSFQYTNDSMMLHLDSDTRHFISFLSGQTFQAPDVMTVECEIKTSALYVIPTTTSHILDSILAHKFSITVYIKHQGAEVNSANGLVYEYKTEVDMVPEEEVELDLYITAIEPTAVTIGLVSTNIEIIEILIGEEAQISPFTITLNEGEKKLVKVKVIGYEENVTANVTYGVTPSGGTIDFLYTEVDVGLFPPSQERMMLLGLVGVFLIFIIALVLITVMKQKRKNEETKVRRSRDPVTKKGGK